MPAPQLPGNVSGTPLSPGASPMLSPGAGKGNAAASGAQVKAVMGPLHQALAAFPPGSKEYKAVLRALTSLEPIFGPPQEGNLVPAAVQQMGNAAQQGSSPLASVAPGLKPAPPAGAGASPPMAA